MYHPQVVLEDESGKILDFYYLPEKAYIEVSQGEKVAAGHVLAKTPREASGTQDITGGLPRVTEIFEARKPKDPAIMAEIDGKVELLGEKRRGKRTIVVKNESGVEREHLVTHGKHLRVHAGDIVKAGEALVDGPLVPHDILRISGEEEVQRYLVREIQNVYRSQRVDIDDKHIEIIVSQMLRKVKIETFGDTDLLPGSVLDKFDFKQANDKISSGLRITDKGDSEFAVGSVVPKDVLAQANAQIEVLARTGQGNEAEARHGKHAVAGHHEGQRPEFELHLRRELPGDDEGAHRGALAGKVDNLVGLKENVILGHLIPAGTGFKTFQAAEVRVRPEALDALRIDRDNVLTRQFPLLEAAPAAGEAGSEIGGPVAALGSGLGSGPAQDL